MRVWRSPAEALEDGVVRLASLDGQTLGTGFPITPQVVLTCHHVVAGVADLMVAHASGEVPAQPLDDPQLALYDLAVLQCQRPLGSVLPSASVREPPAAFESRGYHYGGAGFTSSLPLHGRVLGSTTLRYGEYSVDAWALGGMAFGQGMSGAPLMDAESGVVVGLITARTQGLDGSLTGTGIPLFNVAHRADRLADLLAENSATVPRFGGYVNVVGARQLIAEHAARTAQNFEDRGIFLPDRDVPRTALAEVLDAFLAGETTLLPVVGMAGAGKSSFVASLAAAGRLPLLVIPALAIERPSEGLDVLCDRALEVAMSHAGPRTSFAQVFGALASAEARPVVVVEGLNEARISPGEMRDPWLPNAARWAKRTGVKLVCTCRPEYWDEMFGALSRAVKELMHAQARIGEFSEGEVRLALGRYGVAPGDEQASKLFRHPLMLRIVSELEHAGGPSHELRRSQAIDRFLELRSIAVAHRVPGSPPPSHVRKTLTRLGRALLGRSSLDLERETFDALIQPPDLGWALFKENLLFESGPYVRFTFDEISEFLISESVELRALGAWTEARPGDALLQLSPAVVSHVLRRAHDADDPGLPATVEALARASADDSSWNVVLALRAFLRTVPDASRFVPAVRSIAASAAQEEGEYSMLRGWTLEILGEAALPAEEALDMVRMVAPREDGYGLRDKDYERGDPSGLTDDLGTALTQIVERHGAAALDALAGWLPDETKLAGGEASIGSVAATVLWASFDRWASSTLDAVASTEHTRAVELITRRFSGAQRELALQCARWIDEQRLVPEFVFLCVQSLATSSADRAVPLYRRLVSATHDPKLRARVREQLARHGAASDQDVGELLQSLDQGTSSLYQLEQLIESHWDRIEQIILTRASQRRLGGYDRLGVGALGYYTATPEIERRQAALLATLRTRGQIAEYDLGSLLEQKLNRLAPDVAEAAGYVDLAEEVARGSDPAARQCLVYVAYSSRPHPGREAIERRLRAALIETATDTEMIKRLLDTARHRPGELLLPALDALMPRLDDTARGDLAFSMLWSSHGKSEPLVRWVVANRHTLGGRSRLVLRRLDEGMSPGDAVKAAVEDLIDDLSDGDD
jgi:hypothetical protein